MTRIADHDELAAAFHQMESAAADGGDKGIAADLTLHIPDGPAHDTATLCGLGLKDGIKPSVGVGMGNGDHLHRNSLTQEGLTIGERCQPPGSGSGFSPAAMLARI
jgi:hypothetical protein